MPVLLTTTVLIASGSVSAACACAAFAYHRWQRSKPRTPRSQLDQRSTLRRNNANGMRRRRVIRVGDDALNARLPPNTRRALVGEECMVCRDEPLFFPTKTPTKKCKHRPEVCTDCLRRILEEAVYSGPSQGDIARCPSIGCNQWLKRADMYAWADPETIKKYEGLLKGPAPFDVRSSKCMDSKCKGVLKRVGRGYDTKVLCSGCRIQQCYVHQSRWHEGYSCKQWDKKRATIDEQNNALSYAWIAASTKACPGPKCGRRIQKNDGCDHMICRKPAGCGHQFCWVCLAPWEPIRRYDNSKHYDNCRYYSGKPGCNPAPMSISPRQRWWQVWKKS